MKKLLLRWHYWEDARPARDGACLVAILHKGDCYYRVLDWGDGVFRDHLGDSPRLEDLVAWAPLPAGDENEWRAQMSLDNRRSDWVSLKAKEEVRGWFRS